MDPLKKRRVETQVQKKCILYYSSLKNRDNYK